MKDANCGYCMRGELLDKFGIFICDLQVSSLILFKEQSKPGRCIVAYRDHVSEIIDISDEERNLFMEHTAIQAVTFICISVPSIRMEMSGEEPFG